MVHLLAWILVAATAAQQLLQSGAAEAPPSQRMKNTLRQTPAEYEAQAIRRQAAFCLKSYPSVVEKLGNLVATAYLTPNGTACYVYRKGDIVSASMLGGGWESAEVKDYLRAIRLGVQAPDNTLAVDVGANVGVHTMSLASEGIPVFAFEAMPSNLMLLRSTLCRTDAKVMSKVTLFSLGAGSQRMECTIFAHNDNRGDGHMACSEGQKAQMLSIPGFVARGRFIVDLIDNVVQKDVTFMKIDVEGAEPGVIRGAWKLLSTHTVLFVMMEYSTAMLKGFLAGSEQHYNFLSDILSLGYSVSKSSFFSGHMDAAQLANLSQAGINGFPDVHLNLWLVHPIAFRHPNFQAAVGNDAKGKATRFGRVRAMLGLASQSN